MNGEQAYRVTKSANESRVVISKDGPTPSAAMSRFPGRRSAPTQKEVPKRGYRGKVFPLQEKYMLCCCGHSNNKSFCDGSHAAIKFRD